MSEQGIVACAMETARQQLGDTCERCCEEHPSDLYTHVADALLRAYNAGRHRGHVDTMGALANVAPPKYALTWERDRGDEQ